MVYSNTRSISITGVIAGFLLLLLTLPTLGQQPTDSAVAVELNTIVQPQNPQLGPDHDLVNPGDTLYYTIAPGDNEWAVTEGILSGNLQLQPLNPQTAQIGQTDERIAGIEDQLAQIQTQMNEDSEAGFSWWVFFLGVAAAGLIIAAAYYFLRQDDSSDSSQPMPHADADDPIFDHQPLRNDAPQTQEEVANDMGYLATTHVGPRYRVDSSTIEGGILDGPTVMGHYEGSEPTEETSVRHFDDVPGYRAEAVRGYGDDEERVTVYAVERCMNFAREAGEGFTFTPDRERETTEEERADTRGTTPAEVLGDETPTEEHDFDRDPFAQNGHNQVAEVEHPTTIRIVVEGEAHFHLPDESNVEIG